MNEWLTEWMNEWMNEELDIHKHIEEEVMFISGTTD